MELYKRSPYVSWIRHLEFYVSGPKVVQLNGESAEILVHPQHKRLVIEFAKNIFEELDTKDKTLQLYFYSVGWLVPIMENGDVGELYEAMSILEKILDVDAGEADERAWNMFWDDHAVCERLCVLLELKKNYQYCANLADELLAKIDIEVERLSVFLERLLANSKWQKNNHRIFHLLASFIYADYRKDERGKELASISIEKFIQTLVDRDTGFSLEQSISYCFFDLVILKSVDSTLRGLSAPLDLSVELIEANLNRHVAAISFPDGSIPASGDTPHGIFLTDYQKRFSPKNEDVAKCWCRLEKIGYYRGCSNDGSSHFLALTHNAESAHGHASPLHTDFWLNNFGSLLVDSGGPYKYGSKEKYKWYSAARGHNSLSIRNKNQQNLKNISLRVFERRLGYSARAEFETSIHDRSCFTYCDAIFLHEKVYSEEEWEIYYNLAEGCVLNEIDSGVFEVSKPGSIRVLKLTTNFHPSGVSIVQTERCTGHSKSVFASSLRVTSTPGHFDYFLSFVDC